MSESSNVGVCDRCKLEKVLSESVPELCERCAEYPEDGEVCPWCACNYASEYIEVEGEGLFYVCRVCKESQNIPTGTCSKCKGRNKRLTNKIAGKPVCSTCYLNNFKKGKCSRCAQRKPLPSFHPGDPISLGSERRRVCRDCFKALIYSRGRCPRCKNVRMLKRLDPEVPQNSPKLKVVVRICGGCFDFLTKSGICSICKGSKILRHIHPQDKKLKKRKKRRICKTCHEKTKGKKRRYPLGKCGACPNSRKDMDREIHGELLIRGKKVPACRQCIMRHALKGICSHCSVEKVLWQVHPEDRALPDDQRRRVCNYCYRIIKEYLGL